MKAPESTKMLELTPIEEKEIESFYLSLSDNSVNRVITKKNLIEIGMLRKSGISMSKISVLLKVDPHTANRYSLVIDYILKHNTSSDCENKFELFEKKQDEIIHKLNVLFKTVVGIDLGVTKIRINHVGEDLEKQGEILEKLLEEENIDNTTEDIYNDPYSYFKNKTRITVKMIGEKFGYNTPIAFKKIILILHKCGTLYYFKQSLGSLEKKGLVRIDNCEKDKFTFSILVKPL